MEACNIARYNIMTSSSISVIVKILIDRPGIDKPLTLLEKHLNIRKKANFEIFIFQNSKDTVGILGKKIRVLLSEVKPKTFRLLVWMLHHRATGDSWELRSLIKGGFYLNLNEI